MQTITPASILYEWMPYILTGIGFVAISLFGFIAYHFIFKYW